MSATSSLSISTAPSTATAEAPAQAVSFARLGAQARTTAALARMGIETPTLIQARAIPPLLAGHDVIGQSRTGSGKTIAFGLPLVERIDPRLRRVQALVLVPTRELAAQVAGVLEQLDGGRGLRVAQLIGGRSIGPQRDALQAGAQVVVGAPGRVLDLLRQRFLDLGALRLVVLDEADQMLDAGFAPDVERILAATPPTRQMALFTATLPEWTTKLAQRYLREPVRVDAGSPETRPAPAIEQIVYLVPDGCRLSALRALLDRRRDAEGTTLVFGRTKHGVKKLAKQLGALGYPVAALQGNMSQNARDRVLADFRAGQVPILLATNVAARGLDVLTIEQVINYELPESAELFTHRVGRTGRMERQGEAITVLTAEDIPTWRRMQRELGVSLAPRAWPMREMPLVAMTSPPPAQEPSGSVTGRPATNRTATSRASRRDEPLAMPRSPASGHEQARTRERHALIARMGSGEQRAPGAETSAQPRRRRWHGRGNGLSGAASSTGTPR